MTHQREALNEWLEKADVLLAELTAQGIGVEKPAEQSVVVGQLAVDQFADAVPNAA